MAVRLSHADACAHPSPGAKGAVGQIGVSCLASFVRLPSDLTPYSGCAELRIGDVLVIRVILQKNGTLHALHTLLTRKGSGDAVSPDQRDNDQPQYDRVGSPTHLNWTPPKLNSIPELVEAESRDNLLFCATSLRFTFCNPAGWGHSATLQTPR